MLTNYNNYGIIVYNQELNKLYVNKQAKKLHNNKSEVWINKFKRKNCYENEQRINIFI